MSISVAPRKFVRYVPVFLVLLFGLAVTAGTFWLLRTAERDRVNAEVIRRASTLSAAIQREIDGGLEVVDAVGGFFDGSVEVTRAEFRTFTRALLANHREIQALEWIPFVTAAERTPYETAARREGYSDFRFTERSADGSLREEEDRAEYYPVYYVEPLRGNEAALGYDLGSETARRRAIELARDTNTKAATERIVLVQENGSAGGFLIFRPVYRKGVSLDSADKRRENLLGLTVGVFRTNDIVESGIKGLPANHFDIYLEDDSAFEEGRFLYARKGNLEEVPNLPPTEELRVALSLFTVISPKTLIDVSGRRWLVHFVPTQQLLASVGRPFPLEGAALVFLFTMGMAGYMFMRLRRLLEAEAHSHELQRRLDFERVVSVVSSRFSANKTFDVAVNESLADMGRLSGAGRAYLFLFSGDGFTVDNTHEWCAEGVSPQIDNLKNLPCDICPWWTDKIKRGETIHIEDVSGMPPEAEAEKKILESQDIKSLLVLPVLVGSESAGFLGFDDVTQTGIWAQDSLAILRVGAEIIGNALKRKRAEEARDRSEERFRRLSEATPDGIAISEQGIILDANQNLADLLRCEVSELIGKRILDFVVPESRDLVRQKIFSGSEDTYETVVVKKDGTTFIAEVQGKMLSENGRTIRIATVRDITERRQAEEALRQSEEKLRRIFENARIGIAVLDMDLRITDLNEAKAQMHGYENKEELLGKKALELSVARRHELAMSDFRYVLETGAGRDAETVFLRKDGTEFAAEVNNALLRDSQGRPSGFIVISRDITERKIAEERNAQQNRLLTSVFEAIPYAFYVIDAQEYTVKMANSAARLGEMSQGITCFALTHGKNRPCDAEGERCPLNDVKRTKQQVTVEHIHYDKDGKARTVEVYAYPILGTEGIVVQMIEFCLDITERKRMQEHLIMQDRMASIGQLVSGVAHEVNNPLTGIIGFSDLLLARDLPEDIRGDVKMISDEARRTAAIVKNLLTFARRQPQDKQAVDLNECIQRVLALRAYEQKVNNIQVNTRFNPNLPRVLGNGSQLQQVFFNIIINAEFFMLEAHKQGTLTVTTERTGDMVRASILDDGPGITREDMPRLFSPFFTTKEVGKGTGLGLSICLGIITEHGGRIHVESEPAKGAMFTVELPVYRVGIGE